MLRTYFSFIFFCLLFAAPSHAAQIGAVVIEPMAGGERLLLRSSEALTQKKLLQLTNPDRVAIDFQKIATSSLSISSGYEGVVKGLRFGQFDATTSRVTMP